MSVLMMPGRISYTGMSNSPSRAAHSLVAMLTPALEMQYSPRLGEATVAEIEEMLTMQPAKSAFSRRCSIIQLATACVRKYGPWRLTAHHPLEALLGGFQDVGPHFGRDAGVVDQHVQAAESLV